MAGYEAGAGGGDPLAPGSCRRRVCNHSSGGSPWPYRTRIAPPQRGTGRAQPLHVAAATSFVLSIALWFAGSREEGLFVGLWVPSILAAGAFWIAAVRTR